MPQQYPPTPRIRSRELLREPLSFFLNLTREYGDVVCYRPAPEPAYLVNHPDYIRHVLIDNNRNYSKATYINQMFKIAVADGLLTSEGETWLRQRRMIQPAFHQHHLAQLDGLITSQTARMLESWQQAEIQNKPILIAQEMAALTLAITTQALFGVNMGQEINQVGQAVDMGGALIERPKSAPFREAIQTIEGIVQRVITRRRQTPDEADESHDLLGSLMRLQDQDGSPGLEDAELRNQVITLLLAGYETTASALTWTFFLLSQHPEATARLRQEVHTVLDGRMPAYTDLPALDYTHRVFEESLRLYPPAWVIGRVAQGEDQIGEYFVPTGTIVAISPYTIHRHPGFWQDPERFDPERFTPKCSAGRHRFAYIPFGSGPRQCIGNTFAMLEAALIIAMIVQRFELSLVPGQEMIPEVAFVLSPDKQMKMTVRKCR